jgi:ketosteroid isomerase-like protein
MTESKYASYFALDPFFDVVMRGMAGEFDGDHYFETIADDAVFEFRYVFPHFPTEIKGRDALMALYSGYGDTTVLHSGDALVVHRSQEPGVLIIEYEVHGKKLLTGKAYDNRFVSVVTIKDRKVVHWRDYMDSLAAFTAETGAGA